MLAIACGGGSEGDATAGAEVYATYCESCHGADGTLGVEVGGEPASNLQEEVVELSDDQLMDVIQNGEGTMPAQPVDDTEAADCIAYMHEQWG